MSNYQRILVPIDGSPTSDAGAREAIALAKLTGGQLRFLHYLDPMPFFAGLEGAAAIAVDAVGVMRKDAEQMLQRARDQAVAQGVAADTVLVDTAGGRLSDQVREQADHWLADLVVVGTHGRRGVRRTLLGSDAEDVARTSPVPVLLVRSREQGK
ncbi:MAG: universal stress protein [Burkholderiaceae bacterium]|nr:universal stress protein [Burkholderiaceae bacterium]